LEKDGHTCRGQTVATGQSLAIPIARLTDQRHVVDQLTEEDCSRQDRLQGRDTAACRPGVNVDLFPATATYFAATVVDPASRHWDYEAKRYVSGPVASRVFLQFVGRHPDFNRNGVDDYVDILTGKSKDRNHDGIPDEAQKPPRHGRQYGD
jgi:hypothetical protein